MFITGMHRSGTSATANIVTKLGLTQSAELLPAHLFNPGGHFESLELYRANEEILGTLGHLWDVPPQASLKEQDLYAIRDSGLLQRLRNEFQNRSTARNWCDKDPRLAVTLPVWDQILLRKVPVIACIRSPEEVAMSLRLREGIPFELGVMLWRYYNQNLRDNCQGRKTLVIDYELDLRTDATRGASKIANFINDCGYSVDQNQLEEAANAFQPSFHRSKSVPKPEARTDQRHSTRLLRALDTYTQIRRLPINEWPETLEASTQVCEEDDQWLMLHKRCRQLEAALTAQHHREQQQDTAQEELPTTTEPTIAPIEAQTEQPALVNAVKRAYNKLKRITGNT